MPPEAIMIMVIVAILAGSFMIASIFKSIFRYAQSRHQKETVPGSSLTTGELERLVRKAVEDATEPLHDRIDRLEERLTTPPRLTASPADARLLLPDDEVPSADEATRSVVSRRRVR